MHRSLLLLLLAYHPCLSQDSLVRFSELKFSSVFEKQAFHSIRAAKLEYLALMLSLDPDMSETKMKAIRGRIDNSLQQLQASGLDKKKPDKKAKMVYDKVQAEYLKKYELENRFQEIFSNGNYNCVTASALTSIILSDLDIPYEIKEEPTHVFLVAYPHEGNILLETTSPISGYLSFNEAYKQNFVDNLKKQKIIGSTEATASNTEELFNKYYFQDKSIDLKKLAGLHYMNDAIFYSDKGENELAFHQSEKAYLLYPSQRCQFLLVNFGAQILAGTDVEPLKRALYIGKMSRYRQQGITDDMIQGELINLTQEVLTKQNNKALYAQCFQVMMEKVDDQRIRDQLSYIFFYENGRVLYNQGNYHPAKLYFKKALMLQPENVDLGGVLISTLLQSFKGYKQNKTILDTLTWYKDLFPSLKQNNNFNAILAASIVIQFGQEYEIGNAVKGEEYRKQFDEMIKTYPDMNIDNEVIGLAYSRACVYWFKKGQKTKAREMVTKGLEYAPDNYELRMRQQMLGR